MLVRRRKIHNLTPVGYRNAKHLRYTEDLTPQTLQLAGIFPCADRCAALQTVQYIRNSYFRYQLICVFFLNIDFILETHMPICSFAPAVVCGNQVEKLLNCMVFISNVLVFLFHFSQNDYSHSGGKK